jgi:peptide chain release factor 2
LFFEHAFDIINIVRNIIYKSKNIWKTCSNNLKSSENGSWIYGGFFDIDGLKSKVNSLRSKVNETDFWQDRERAVAITKEQEKNEKEIAKWENLLKEITDLEQLVAIASQEGDLSISDDAHSRHEELKKELDSFEFLFLFRGKYDRNNAIVSIHAGTGGVDAQDWAEILERMILRYAEKKKLETEVLEQTIGNEAGIKSASIRVSGDWSYGYFKSESGVHRLVRISPFDAESMRHTSFALIDVIPELPDADEIDIKDSDLRIDVFRSSGPGGQGVNTTDSAVRIVHIPTNITVTCQSQRSQHQNKENALRILKSKIFKMEDEAREKEKHDIRGDVEKAEWGKQIRSYVMQPYQMVKDHRTEHETSDIRLVLDGNLDGFVESYLRVKS